MNSPREMDDSDADTDATYCSEAETKGAEGCLNANQRSTAVITQPNGNEKSQYECTTGGKTSEDLFEDQEIQENTIPDSLGVQISIAQPLPSKNITQATETNDVFQTDICGQEIPILYNDELALRNIIADSEGAQCSNVQPSASINITNSAKVRVDTQADNFKDESTDIIPLFQSTLSFLEDDNDSEKSKKNFIHRSLTTQKDYQNHFHSHSEPLQVIHKEDQYPGQTEFYSEPSKVNSNSAIKSTPLHNLPKKKLLEHHRLKMKTHFQTLTSRLYSIKNEASSHFLSCGPKLEKTRAMTLFEEVKVLRQILTQLYEAAERLVSYARGKSPLKSTEFSAADQTCEKLLVQLNPESFRENFTPLRHEYDSDQEGDQMFTEELSYSQDYEEENPEIMEEQEDNSPPHRVKVSKNVRFQSPLIERATHANSEMLSNTMAVDRLNEGRNAIASTSALKRAYSQIGESTHREHLVTVVDSEASVMYRHNAKSLTYIPEERSIVKKNETDIVNFVVLKCPSSQRLDDASIYVPDDNIGIAKENSKLSSQASIYDTCITRSKKRSISSIRGREYSSPDRQAPSPEMTFTDTDSSKICRISKSHPDYLRNISEAPTVSINSQQKTVATGDPGSREKGRTSTENNIQCHSFDGNDSDPTYFSQESAWFLNHNATMPCPQPPSMHVTAPLISKVTQDRAITGNSDPSASDSINNVPTINNGIQPQNNYLVSQTFQHEAEKGVQLTRIDDMQEGETCTRCQTQNAEYDSQDTCLTHLEPTNNQNAKIVGSLKVIPGKGEVAKEAPKEQINIQDSENFSINNRDISFDCFSSDEDTQMSCSQPPYDRINISSSECTNINDDSHSQCPVFSSRESINQKESTRSKDVFQTKKCDLSKENRDTEVIISESLSQSQPPGWCNIFEQHKEKKTLPTLTELMIAGMISPGEMVLSIKGSRTKATLLKNAKILTTEGATFHTPMAWCSAWHEGKTVSRTIAYHRVYYNGVTLMDICQRAFKIAVEEMASAIQEKRRREHSEDFPVASNEKSTYLPDGHTMTVIKNNSEIAMEPKKESPEDIIMAIHSVYIHNDEEYVDAGHLGDILDNGATSTIHLDFIDQW